MRTWSSNSLRSVPAKRSANAFMSGARIAVRTTRIPDDLNTSANRAPSFVSWSQTTTCGTRSMVAFLACCAHHSSVGAYVTAAWRIVRRRRSRKKSTNTSRNRMSNVCTKSHAHVTWFRRNVDQLCPSPRGRERRMYRCIVRLHTRMPSLSSSPRMRSAPQRGLRPAISRMSAARVVGGHPDPPRATPPERAESCAMPTENGRGLDEQGCFTPSWRDSRGENNREALPGRPPDAPGNLPLGDDELLSKKRVLGDQFDATANEIRGQSENESKKVDHGSSLTLSARMTFVARTGDDWITKVA